MHLWKLIGDLDVYNKILGIIIAMKIIFIRNQ